MAQKEFGKDARQDCIQRPKVQIGPNRPQIEIRIEWDKNPVGPDRPKCGYMFFFFAGGPSKKKVGTMVV